MKYEQVSVFELLGEPEEMTRISDEEAVAFLLPRHYLGRRPAISVSFGWYKKGILKAVATFGKPASHTLCDGICGSRYTESVYELNRLCRTDDLKEPLSRFVGFCLRQLRKKHWIIVSYSDTAMNHHGYIYQACNFLYTGCTRERTDFYTGEGKHSRHVSEEDIESGKRKVRSAKHRYVYFCTDSKAEKKAWMEALNYPVLPYPKGDNNADYELGYVLEDVVIDPEEDCFLP